MRRFSLIFLIFFLPIVVQAACSSNGYTVVFVNGVFSTREQAEEDELRLREKLGVNFNNQPIVYKTGYNQTHLAGAGDLIETYFPSFDAYDLNTILMQIAPEVQTRKLLIVGHSQGSVYANKMYEYLVAHGEPAGALAVYAVATPDSYVAGGGTYLTYALDDIINGARLARGLHPLPANVDFLDVLDSGKPNPPPPAHSFTDAYLATFANRIVSDIGGELGALKAVNASSTGDCFVPPAASLAYRAEQVGFAIADPAALGVKVVAVGTYQTGVAATLVAVSLARAGVAAAGAAFGFVAGLFANNPVAVAEQHPVQNFEVVKKLYGSSLSPQEMQELLSSANQGASAVLALSQAGPGVVLGAQTGPAAAASADTAASTTPVAQPAASSATTTQSAPPVVAPVAAPTDTASDATANSNSFAHGTEAPSPAPPPPADLVATTTATTTVEVASTDSTGSPQAIATTSTASTTASVGDQGGSTSATSSTQTATTSVPFVPQAGNTLADTFDTFNSAGWQVFGDGVKNFDFDDATTSVECFHNGCAVGFAAYTGSFVPRMYLEQAAPLSSGAFTVYARARSMFNPIFPVVSVCQPGSACADAVPRINFLNVITVDDTWHQYYVAWKQGAAHIETCILVDNTDAADCSWVDTGIALGTQFSAIALWDTNGYRSDLGDNLWFDELAPVQ